MEEENKEKEIDDVGAKWDFFKFYSLSSFPSTDNCHILSLKPNVGPPEKRFISGFPPANVFPKAPANVFPTSVKT